ncbi:MAG TPA: LamG domain-containing protein [Bacteroidales bacterium]|nr:LamG domain-containing protein [Bacteroidales bacterium]
MKRLIFVLWLCVFTSFSLSAQSPAKVKKVNSQQNEVVKKAQLFLASNLNLVFYLPCDNTEGWDSQLVPNQSAVFGNDRFNNKENAIVFSTGHRGLQAKPQDYIKGDFTISVWVNVETISKWSRIIDFGVGQNNSNIVFSNSASMSGIPGLAIYKGEGSDITQLRGTEKDRLKEGEWHHIGAILKGVQAFLFLDGVQINDAMNFYVPGTVHRPVCLIGKSNFEGESNFYGSMDDLRIYDKALTDIEMKLLAGWIFELDSIPSDTIHKVAPNPGGSGSGGGTGGSGSQKPTPGPEKPKPGTPAPKTIPDNKSQVPDEPFQLYCSKYTYKTLETVDLKPREEMAADINKLIAPYNKTNWRLKGDISLLRAYRKEDDNELWEHKFVMFEKGDNGIQTMNALGKEGWEMVYYQLYGATFSRPVNPASQNKWEYTIVTPPGYAKDEKELAANREAAESFLSGYGKQGWDLLYIFREQHVMKKVTGSKLTYEYRIIQSSGIVPYSLSAGGWEFAACPAIRNSVNFLTPIVIKKSSDPQYKIYIAKQVERMGLLGGGNTNVYDDQDNAIAKYAALGWKYEDISDGLENANILFSAPLNCLDPHKPVIYFNYAPDDPAARDLAVRFAEYLKGENCKQIVRYTHNGKAEVEKAAIEAGKPVILGTKANTPLPEIENLFFSDLGYAVNVIFIENGQPKSFEYRSNMSLEEMHAKFGEMFKENKSIMK